MINKTARLLLGLFTVALVIVGLDHFSDEVDQIRYNRELDIEVDAYFYSELGDLEEFLDDTEGRYSLDR